MAVFDKENIEEIVLKWYKKEGSLHDLPGEKDRNFLLTDTGGERFILKIYHPGENQASLDAQNRILLHLARHLPEFQTPAVIPNTAGDHTSTVDIPGHGPRFVRLLSWTEGKLWAKTSPHSPELLESLGHMLGYLCRGMEGFDHPAAHRQIKWDLSGAAWTGAHLEKIPDAGNRTLARHFYEKYAHQVQPRLSSLRKSVIHNDANDYNLLVGHDAGRHRVSGLIDFGDFVFAPTVQELAVALAYACMHKPDPLTAAHRVVKGMHQVFPLQDEELELLYYLIAARLLLSVTISAMNAGENPENEYLQISAQPAWDLLHKWYGISPYLAWYTFRHACGMEPCPAAHPFRKLPLDFLSGGLRRMIPDIHFPLVPLDLSVGSPDLGNNSNFLSIPAFEKTVTHLLEEGGGGMGIGGYGEVRPFYTSDAYLVYGNEGPRWRTVHLGLDIWAQAGTVVCAPLDGVVHSAVNNEGERNYGPTIILRHEIPLENGPLTFYTLYGHLSLASLKGIEPGDRVSAGAEIARIGPAPENGNWPPHLHFQVMLDLLGNTGDFPGVAFPEHREIWMSICPDPMDLLDPQNESGLRDTEKRSPGAESILRARQRSLPSNLSVSYRNPLHVVRGYGQYLYDDTARRYLDTVNNVAHVGHSHPAVVRAAHRQNAVLNTNTRYLHEHLVRYAEKLGATFPGPLEVVFFVNSGSEANELALRLARTYTGRYDVAVLQGGYHGNTTACVDISSYKFDGPGGKGAQPFVHVVPMPDPVRGKYRSEAYPGHCYAKEVQQLLQANSNTAAFISESIMSCGGQIVLPEGFLAEVYRYVRSSGGLCIADEVQTGLGRTGRNWAFEWEGVVPDIVTMGKPIGNGHPLGAVITTREIARAFDNGMEYFNTFGGNPVSCAVGMEVLHIVEEEELMKKSAETGHYLMEGLRELASRFPVIRDVRGRGLFAGFELTVPGSDHPAGEQTGYLSNRLRELGILSSTDGPLHNVIKIKPPLVFNRANAGFFLEMTERVLREDLMQE